MTQEEEEKKKFEAKKIESEINREKEIKRLKEAQIRAEEKSKMEQMQQIAEGLKESAQNYKKRNKSQEHGAGAEMDDDFVNSS